MTMNFNAKEANKTTNATREAQQERARKCAEIHVEQMIEPMIKDAANRGENNVDVHFHNSTVGLYGNINVILCENGFETSFNRERTCLHIKW